ncbi:MAG TPA: FemAB family XrtA/PEP-CTERM system-associated protein [Stellaceae bacterium]|nr:FemAB family XrtA/PEP-CTERM system-associated protein [Stellaceae bacterium]
MALVIRELDDKSAPAWDRFVDDMPDGTFFHRAGWQAVIEQAFGHPTCYLMAERDGAVAGVLPLAHLRSRLFGNSLVSVPFCVYGGPLASERESSTALVDRAEDLMRRVGADSIEFRTRQPAVVEWPSRDDLYATFRKPIAADPDANLKAIPRKQRAMVRKGMQNGLRSEVDRDTDRLHRIYAESVRNLGTPVFSRRYFRLLAERFRDCSETLTIVDGERPIASVLSFFFRDEVLPYYGGGTAEARQRAANDFMYWEVMRRAALRGARLFDFGRSKFGTGSFDFKKFWGFTPEPLHYQYRLRPGCPIPDHNPLNPKYRLLIAAWKRLPLPVANLLGPPIVRGIG